MIALKAGVGMKCRFVAAHFAIEESSVPGSIPHNHAVSPTFPVGEADDLAVQDQCCQGVISYADNQLWDEELHWIRNGKRVLLPVTYDGVVTTFFCIPNNY